LPISQALSIIGVYLADDRTGQILAYIVQRQIGDRVETSEIDEPILLVGCGAIAHLRLDDETLGAIHASIVFEGNHFELVDHQSPTGTYLNGERIHRAALRSDDRITIGTHILGIQLASPEGPLTLEVDLAEPKASTTIPREIRRVDYAEAYSLHRTYLNKTLISAVLIGIGLVILAGALASGKTAAFRPGAVSGAHALITNQCSQCHSPWQGPTEAACQECHDGPKHHEQQVRTPSCFACHPEHRGQISLASVENQRCLTCHADLKTNSGKPSIFKPAITSFNDQSHPEFALTLAGITIEKRARMNEEGTMRSDPGKLKLNHALHLKPEVKDPEGTNPVNCQTCHRPNIDGRQMSPMTFQEHCKRCHELVFDPQFPDLRVPHGNPEIVRAYLVNVYAEAKGVVMSPPERRGRIPDQSPAVTLSPAITDRVANAEMELYKVHCTKCHEADTSAKPLAKVVKPNIPVIWFRHARFAHKPHRLLHCVACHENAPTSEKTEDVLLPGIRICQSCHIGEKQDSMIQTASAPAECSACHTYHDKQKDRDWKGQLKIKKILGLSDREK